MKKHFLFVSLFICTFFNFTNAQNANFSGSPISGCSPLIVSFQDQSTGATSYLWNFGNGNTSNLQNPSATYSLPGQYTVTLTINGGADVETKTNYINVFANPTASFSISSPSVCVGANVTFTSTSTQGSGAIVKYRWTFGDGTVDTTSGAIATHEYLFAQTFPVSLVITDANGCNATASSSITVVPGPAAIFSQTPLSACSAPASFTFNNTSTGNPSSYAWNFGDGNTSSLTSPAHTYNDTGVYIVTLIAQASGCSDTTTRTVIIRSTTAGMNVDTSICFGQTLAFQETTSPVSASRFWNFDDPTSGAFNTSTLPNPTHYFTAPGTYNVRLIATANGCADTIFQTITVHPQPVAAFSADTLNGCNNPFIVDFTDASTSNITAWVWTFGDGGTDTTQNPAHPYTATGLYDVQLIVTDANGCKDTLLRNDYINVNPPIANFIESPDSGCAPLTVNFNSISTSPDPIVNYQWIFGDGNNANTTTVNTNHTYTATGAFDVTLIVTTSTGCTDTLVKPLHIRVGNKPNANFSWSEDTVCRIESVNFTDLSTPVDSTTSWFWDFGDGGTSTQQNPSHQFADTGLFTITLIVRSFGCADTLIINDLIKVLPPKAEFTFTQSCANYFEVIFDDNSKGADSVVWKFGDGTIDSTNNTNPTHIYSVRGPMFVTLIAYNFTTGCLDSVTQQLIIAEPIAFFNMLPKTGCYPLTVNFTDASQDAISFGWDFGDGTPNSILQNPSHTYALPGFYTVTHTITDLNGCVDQLVKVDSIHVLGPTPGFIANVVDGCADLIVTFTDTSLTEGAGIASYSWNFGDGNTQIVNTPNVSHTYTNPGIFTVTLTVVDSNGCAKSVIKQNYIRATFPNPSFIADTIACQLDQLLFNAAASTGLNLSYIWNFGDGTIDTTSSNSINHSYLANGVYPVSLTLVDINGCDTTITRNVSVENPTAAFSVSTSDDCINNRVVTSANFQDLTSGIIPIASWQWNLGNGFSIQQNPQNTYTTSGNYAVQLIVTNLAGCTDTLTQDSIVTVPGPIGSFSFTPTDGCNPLTVNFVGTTLGGNGVYAWEFGDGTIISPTADTILSHQYTLDGSFTPSFLLGFVLPVTGQLCFSPATNITGDVTVQTVLDVDITEASITLTDGQLDTLYAVVTDLSPGGGPPFTYNWSPSGLIAPTNDSIVVVQVNEALRDSNYYYVEAFNNQGCRTIDSILVLYIPCESGLVIPNVFTPNGDNKNDNYYMEGLCPGQDFYFKIYNRWGRIIYETNDSQFRWNGKDTDGNDASDGTYYYVLNTRKNKYHGFIKLIREQ
ncbi:MAG: hypothetical protein RIQ89_2372 [Bacteroidota bacterium]